jgi:predicted nucleic acid-binding Zn ribbon protein
MCSNRFSPVNGGTTTCCSAACRKKYRHKRNQNERGRALAALRAAYQLELLPSSQTCTVCNRPFFARSDAQTCSPECFEKRYYARRMELRWARRHGGTPPLPDRHCVICGNQFSPVHPNHVMCSEVCRRERKQDRNQGERALQTSRERLGRDVVAALRDLGIELPEPRPAGFIAGNPPNEGNTPHA